MFTKIDELIWKDAKFKSISYKSKLLFIYLLSCQHRNVLGIYNLPKYYVSGDLGYPIETVSKGLGELSKNGFIIYHEPSETVFIKNFLRYNPLNNPNQVRGAVKVLDTIPKSPLIFSLIDRLKGSDIKRSNEIIKMVKEFVDIKGYERVPKGFPEPMGEQEEEEEEVEEEVEGEEQTPAKAGEVIDFEKSKVPYKKIVNLYNDILGDLIPSVRKISDKRKKKMKVRWKKDLDTLEKWEELFNAVEEQDFLLGYSDRNWTASFDWLIENDNNFVKVLERQYESSNKNRSKAQEQRRKERLYGEFIDD